MDYKTIDTGLTAPQLERARLNYVFDNRKHIPAGNELYAGISSDGSSIVAKFIATKPLFSKNPSKKALHAYHALPKTQHVDGIEVPVTCILDYK